MRKLLPASLLALAGLGLAAPPSQATLPSYADGDLLLGFRLDGGASDYLIDVGQASLYTRQNGASFTVTDLTVNGFHLSSIGADLSSIFGPTWLSGVSGSFVHWSVAGTDLPGDPTNTTYITRPEVIIGTQSAAILRPNGSSQSQANGAIEGLSLGYIGIYNGGSTVYTQTAAGGEKQGSGDPSAYATYQPPAQSTSYGVYANTEGTFNGSHATTSVLDLYQVVPNNTASTPASFEGSFSITDAGVVTFQSVPEPASLALLLIGTALCGLVRRRPFTHA